MKLNKIYNEDCSVQKSNCKSKILDSVKMFASENSVESINDDLYDAGYVQACNDILEKIRKNDKGDN